MPMPLRLPTFTTDDLRGFPDDGQRYELLDGMLLVTPAPGSAHQVVLFRLSLAVGQYLSGSGRAYAASPGEIELAPRTLLQPDLLVFPATYPPGTPWAEIRDWWLAVEVFSRSSRVYDRDFKRDAYLSLGVAEVWLVDLDEHVVFVSRRGGRRDEPHPQHLQWQPENSRAPLSIALADIFTDIP